MVNTMKQGANKLREIAGVAPSTPSATEGATARAKAGTTGKDTVLIGGHFPRAVRRSLAQLQADPRNDGKKLNDLLAEALDDLFAKYGIPQSAKLSRDA
jgi:hypothetical protein